MLRNVQDLSGMIMTGHEMIRTGENWLGHNQNWSERIRTLYMNDQDGSGIIRTGQKLSGLVTNDQD